LHGLPSARKLAVTCEIIVRDPVIDISDTDDSEPHSDTDSNTNEDDVESTASERFMQLRKQNPLTSEESLDSRIDPNFTEFVTMLNEATGNPHRMMELGNILLSVPKVSEVLENWKRERSRRLLPTTTRTRVPLGTQYN
jgi:hypothetical protein